MSSSNATLFCDLLPARFGGAWRARSTSGTTKLADVGETIADARESLVASLQDESDEAYLKLSAAPSPNGGVVRLRYERSWEGSLLAALGGARNEDVRRGVTSVGPQRDDLFLSIEGMAARTQASQGEQRSLALALRLGGHSLVTARQSSSPVLLLDDVFSELDPHRSAALAACLPEGQTLLTSAGPVPEGLPVLHWLSPRRGCRTGWALNVRAPPVDRTRPGPVSVSLPRRPA